MEDNEGSYSTALCTVLVYPMCNKLKNKKRVILLIKMLKHKNKI